MYLHNMPDDGAEWGLNKLLVTRYLAIDWKHRESEITHYTGIEISDRIRKIRSSKLRGIFHISRNILEYENPNAIQKQVIFRNLDYMVEICDKIFIDFDLFITDNFKETYTNIKTENDIIVYYNKKHKFKNVVKYFIKHNLDVPDNIKSADEIYNCLENSEDCTKLIMLISKNLTEQQTIEYWLMNHYIYTLEKTTSNGEDYSYIKPVTFKSK